MCNNNERLQIFKNNKLITTICNNENFFFYFKCDYNINNINLKLWYAGLGHYYNQNL